MRKQKIDTPVHLSFNDVSFQYPHSKYYILSKLSFEIQRGEFICVVGANGSGKSTLVKIMAGILQPTHGNVYLENEQVGYVQQNANIRESHLFTVRDVVSMGCFHNKKFFLLPQDIDLINEVLNECGIYSIADTSVTNISGGEMRRTFIARGLVSGENMIILDEPTASLDITAQDLFIKHMQRIRKKRTIIVATHSIELIDILSDRVFCLTDTRQDREHAAIIEYCERHSDINIVHMHCSQERKGTV